ncbi:uncharacterized protein LOC108904237 [Anoplophora glabripennis]|uniref:uncharacterized protein LOC108904237 n=1 Tax=Anoplophora glabripennis TaxID=217634 RepID=UPI0008752E59|nr:uncharacterized protein LOC108904237 [Anoplophora glabripennis]
MNKFSERLFAAIVFIVLCETGYVNGLSCYECTSSDGNQCLDKLNKKIVKPIDCNFSIFTQGNTRNEEFICISTKEQNSTESIHTRRCGLKSEESICETIKNESKGSNLKSCVTCQKDLCNASVTIYINLFLLVFAIVSCTNLIKIVL